VRVKKTTEMYARKIERWREKRRVLVPVSYHFL